ncbi:hypothetical protein HUG15_19800 [Salicibibacter cibarius]|uniref:EF-hand domain-containing protein n=1 Tax=Salicibibacter cibarius TaxID=2743000 RepID=A0A7T6Z760_9BACI|nr:hypothetical protein [Salicibibacter cibarius]QQK77606.1 hypothetical protein HUG15_19800 [Salicibibacter cibarius]
MKKIKTIPIKIGAVTGVSALLTGCGATAQDDYMSAYDEVQDADTFEADIQMSMDVESDVFGHEETEMLNNTVLAMDVMSDVANDQHEVDIGLALSMGAMDMNIDMPMFLDNSGDEEKLYSTSDGMIDIIDSMLMFEGFPMNIETPESIQGTVVELPVEDDGQNEEVSEEQEEATENIMAQSRTFLEDMDEEAFTRDEDAENMITYSVDGNVVVDALFDMLEDNPAIFEGVEDMNEAAIDDDLSEIRDEIDEYIEVDEVETEVVLNENGSMATEEMRIPMMLNNDRGETIDMTLHMDVEYNSIDDDLDFSFDLSEDNIISEDEFEEAMEESFNDPMMMP